MLHIELLTDEQQHIRICRDYWQQGDQGEYTFKIWEVAERYGIMPQSVSKIVQKNAYAWVGDISCVRCKKSYIFTTRTQYQKRRTVKNRTCTVCLEEEQKAIEEKKSTLIRMFNQNTKSVSIDLDNSDITCQIYLLSALQALGANNKATIYPLSKYPTCTLSPDPGYDKKILEHLLDKHMLLLGHDNHPDVIKLNDDERIIIDLKECGFETSLGSQQTAAYINDLFDNETKKMLKKSKTFINLCKEVQLYECLSFLDLSMTAHKFNFSSGERTRLALRMCLETFSVAQTYNLIWRGVKDAAAYYMRSTIVKKHAANTAISNISTSYEKALAEGWDVKPFHRNNSLPQSALSKTIFNIILDTNDGGFEYPLHTLTRQYDKDPA